MDVIDQNYIEMFPITDRNDENIKRSFDLLNEHDYYDFNFDISQRDENGNSILHRLIIDSKDENNAINKFLNLPFNVASLYNTRNNDLQTPLHLICIKRYQELFNVMVNKDRTRKTIIKDVLDNIKGHDKDYSNVIFKNKPLKDSFGLFNYNIQDKYGNIPIVYLLNGDEISYENINPEAIFEKIIKNDLTFNYQDDNYLLFHNNNFEFRLIDSNLKGFIDTLKDNTKTNINLNRYRFNSSSIISIQSFIDFNINTKNDSQIYYELLINYLINKNFNYLNYLKDLDPDHKTLFNYLDHLKDLDPDHKTLFDYLYHLKDIYKDVYDLYLNQLRDDDIDVYNEYNDYENKLDGLAGLVGGAINYFNFYFHYLIYTFIVKNPYTKIIHDIIIIPEFQEVISDSKLTDLFVNMGKNNLIEIVRKFIIENKAPAAPPAPGGGYYIKGGDPDDLIDKLHKNIIIHPVSINKNNDNIIHEKIKFTKGVADEEIEINIIDFIPIFTLCAKLYNKYQNKGDDIISQYLKLNDITNGEQIIKFNMLDPSTYKKEMLNIYILTMIFTIYYLLLLEQVTYCVNYNNLIMIDGLERYDTIKKIMDLIYKIVNDDNNTEGANQQVTNLIQTLKTDKISNNIINDLTLIYDVKGVKTNSNQRNRDTFKFLKYYYDEVQDVMEYKNRTNAGVGVKSQRVVINNLLNEYNSINIKTKLTNTINLINNSIKNFNDNIKSIFINNNQYTGLFKEKTNENYELKDVTVDNYYTKIKELVKLIKQIQNNLIENVFKINKETIKKNLQNILNKLGICNEYRDTDEDSKKILVPLENDVKFTNSFKSLADNLTAQSEDFQNIYKSNINKFNNIILQNIDILHPH